MTEVRDEEGGRYLSRPPPTGSWKPDAVQDSDVKLPPTGLFNYGEQGLPKPPVPPRPAEGTFYPVQAAPRPVEGQSESSPAEVQAETYEVADNSYVADDSYEEAVQDVDEHVEDVEI